MKLDMSDPVLPQKQHHLACQWPHYETCKYNMHLYKLRGTDKKKLDFTLQTPNIFFPNYFIGIGF